MARTKNISRKSKDVSDKDIISLFVKGVVSRVIYVDKNTELKHLQKCYTETKNEHYLLCIKYNIKKILENEHYALIITEPRLIAKYKSDTIPISKTLLFTYKPSDMPVEVVEKPLLYNLSELPDY